MGEGEPTWPLRFFKTGCVITIRREAEGYAIQHGDNPEAVLRLATCDVFAMGAVETKAMLKAWIIECHAYEPCSADPHTYCKDEWHRCADGGGKGEYDRYLRGAVDARAVEAV